MSERALNTSESVNGLEQVVAKVVEYKQKHAALRQAEHDWIVAGHEVVAVMTEHLLDRRIRFNGFAEKILVRDQDGFIWDDSPEVMLIPFIAAVGRVTSVELVPRSSQEADRNATRDVRIIIDIEPSEHHPDTAILTGTDLLSDWEVLPE
jgi:hypothetical protein